MEREAFLMKPKNQSHLSLLWEWVYYTQSWKKGNYYVNLCLSQLQSTLIVKNGGKRSFSCETKPSMSFTPMRGMSLWCPIMKGKKIIMWIHVCPHWQTNFNSKNWWKEKLFLWNQSINAFILISRMSLWCLIMKRKEIIMYIHVCPNWKRTLILNNGGKNCFYY